MDTYDKLIPLVMPKMLMAFIETNKLYFDANGKWPKATEWVIALAEFTRWVSDYFQLNKESGQNLALVGWALGERQKAVMDIVLNELKYSDEALFGDYDVN